MKLKRNTKRLLIIVLLSNVLLSCSKEIEESVQISDVIVGSWFAVSSIDESSSIVYSESSSAITLTFRTDGTYSWVLSNTNSSVVPITYNGTYTYNDNVKTIKLKGKAYIGNFQLSQDDTWNVSSLSRVNVKMWTDTGVKGIGARTMVWTKN